MRVCFLGTGASFSNGQRQNTGLLIKTGSHRLLIDCSGSPEYSLARQDVKVTDITDLVLTHAHIDHIYALPSLLQTIRLCRQNETPAKITIHGHPDTIKTAGKLLEVFDFSAKSDTIDIRYANLQPEEGVIDLAYKNLTVEYFPVCHQAVATLGLSITEQDNHLLYSADSEICPAIIKRLTPRSYLIHDCGCGLGPQNNHAGVFELAKILAENDCRQIILTHLPELSDGQIKKIKQILHHHFSGEVLIPQDGQEISIPSQSGNQL
jgi:ribonuclease Z